MDRNSEISPKNILFKFSLLCTTMMWLTIGSALQNSMNEAMKESENQTLSNVDELNHILSTSRNQNEQLVINRVPVNTTYAASDTSETTNDITNKENNKKQNVLIPVKPYDSNNCKSVACFLGKGNMHRTLQFVLPMYSNVDTNFQFGLAKNRAGYITWPTGNIEQNDNLLLPLPWTQNYDRTIQQYQGMGNFPYWLNDFNNVGLLPF